MRRPWLPDATHMRGADDFSAKTATLPARRAGLALALILLLLAMGRAPQILDAAFGYEGPGSDTLLALAEGTVRRHGGAGHPAGAGHTGRAPALLGIA